MAIEGVVWLNPDHGGWLRELGLRGFQLVWASSWGVRARDWIAPRLGLPADLAVIEVPRYGPGFGWSAKFPAITRWVGERRFAWIDDRFGGKEFGWAEQREQAGIPTLILRTDPGHGLRREHVQRLLAWIDSPPAVVGDVVHHSEHDDAAVEPVDCPDGDIAHRLDSDPDGYGYGCGEWGEAAWIEREAERLHTQEWAPDDEPWGSLSDNVREQWRREARQLVRGGRDGRGQ